MSQFSFVNAYARTKASLQRIGEALGLSTSVPLLKSECISLPQIQDVLRVSAGQTHTVSLTHYHSHLEQHQPHLTQPQRTMALSAADTLARADAALAALKAEPSISMLSQQWKQEGLQTAVDALQEARQDYLSGRHSAALQKADSSVRKLTTALHSTYSRLAEAHRTVLSESVSWALTDMGYTIDTASDGERQACWGHKWGNGMSGHGLLTETTIAVVVREDGRLAIDMSGFEGGECEMEMHRLFERLRERGIQANREEVIPHLRKDGGQLISSASGRNARDLLKANVRSESVPGPVHSKRRSRRKGQRDNDSRYRAASAWLWMQQKG